MKTVGMEKFHRKFLKTQFLCSGISNAFLNALLFYLGNRETRPLSYLDAAIDAVISTGFISLLVTLPTAYFTGRTLRAGLPPMPPNRWMLKLPRNPWKLWLALWLPSAAAMEGVFAVIYLFNGFGSIAFPAALIFRFCWCGLLGGVLGVLVGARYLQKN